VSVNLSVIEGKMSVTRFVLKGWGRMDFAPAKMITAGETFQFPVPANEGKTD
jgi:hypothetical protein